MLAETGQLEDDVVNVDFADAAKGVYVARSMHIGVADVNEHVINATRRVWYDGRCCGPIKAQCPCRAREWWLSNQHG